jgi:hypothetical protein
MREHDERGQKAPETVERSDAHGGLHGRRLRFPAPTGGGSNIVAGFLYISCDPPLQDISQRRFRKAELRFAELLNGGPSFCDAGRAADPTTEATFPSWRVLF